MSLFLPNIPQASNNLDFSQGQLLSNNSGLDTVFGIEHYKFSDATSNKGFHNTVTQPLIIGSVHPTTTTNPILYAMQDSANVGTLQYSRGPSNSVPSPVTKMQSTSSPITIAPSGNVSILDFTGLANCSCTFIGYSVTTQSVLQCNVFWNGSTLLVPAATSFTSNSLRLAPLVSGSILTIVSSLGITNFYWTLTFNRTG